MAISKISLNNFKMALLIIKLTSLFKERERDFIFKASYFERKYPGHENSIFLIIYIAESNFISNFFISSFASSFCFLVPLFELFFILDEKSLFVKIAKILSKSPNPLKYFLLIGVFTIYFKLLIILSSKFFGNLISIIEFIKILKPLTVLHKSVLIKLISLRNSKHPILNKSSVLDIEAIA